MRFHPLLLVVPVTALAACAQADPAAHLAAARAALAQEDLARARTELGAALEADRDSAEVLRLLAQVQLLLGDGDGAQTTLVRLEERAGADAATRRLKAEAALLRGQAREALAMLGSDGAPVAWRLRAAARSALDEPGEALAAYRAGMAAGPDFALVRDYARFLLDGQDAQGAVPLVAQLRRLGPGRFDTAMVAARLEQALGRRDAAEQAFGDVARRFPARAEPLLALAELADMRGALDEAEALLKKAAAIAPDHPRVGTLTVQFASERGDWEKVRRLLAPREADLDARSFEGLAYGEALLRLGKPEQARAIYAKALLLSPQNPYARLMLAEAQLATGDAATALRTARPLADGAMAGRRELDLGLRAARAAGDPVAAAYATRLASPDLEARARIAGEGQAALARRDWTAAIAAFRALPGFDADPEVLKRLAMAASEAGRHDEAIGWADRALLLAPRNPDMLHMAALARLNAGRDAGGALRMMREANRMDPANPVIKATLARAQHAAG